MRRPWPTGAGGCRAKNKNYDEGLKNKNGRTELLGSCNLLEINKIKVVLTVVIFLPPPTPHDSTASQVAKASSPHCRGFTITLRHTMLGILLWTSDQPIAQHTTLTTDRHSCNWRNSNQKSQQASGRRPTP